MGAIDGFPVLVFNNGNYVGLYTWNIPKDKWNFLWITEFPFFEYNEETGNWDAMHHPFTMPMEEDIQYLDSDPGRVRAIAYDIVINGMEAGGGSVRIHSSEVQQKIFKALGLTIV